MKARTKFQHQVVAANGRLLPITEKQAEWAFRHTVGHYAFRTPSGQTTCLDCGHRWNETKAKRCHCPNCHAKLTLKDTLCRKTDEYEADLNRLFVMDLATGEKRFVSRAFESNVDAFLWNKDSQSIYFIGVWHGETQIYNIGLADNDSLNRLTDGMHDYASLALCGDKLIAKRHSMSMGDEIYAVNNTRNGNAFAKAEQLTFENKQIYDQLEMGKVEARWMTTTDGKQMLNLGYLPAPIRPEQEVPHPALLRGRTSKPRQPVLELSLEFPDYGCQRLYHRSSQPPRSSGLRCGVNEAISGDYGGQCMKDYFTSIDEMAKEPFVDKTAWVV